MIFETLYASAQRGELLLVAGGFCHWHLRRDGWLVIREIIADPPHQHTGTMMLRHVQWKAGLRVFPQLTLAGMRAKCPADLPSNTWWARQGFDCVRVETTKTGRKVNVWERRFA
jgi:hypothetical protein